MPRGPPSGGPATSCDDCASSFFGSSSPMTGGTSSGPASVVDSAAFASSSSALASRSPSASLSFSPSPSSAGRALPAARSKNRRISTGIGMISVLFFSAETSTTVCSSRSWSAAGSCDMISAAAASRLDAWNSPSAVMMRARRSRSASACRAIERFMPSGSETSLISTRSISTPQGSWVISSMIPLR